ncbi:hypothetical protein K469DRAFT_566041 [Zopfia rhizophila CBS 207.26]|uniref:AAA+ ATPase domain-containing protein n=1 Tax=Zopfia rhizophila CBS 207.26 TaxID=1314779 RepID=A0A6A6ECH2_9PEZI|nr:hypothetical protein K469DRAFT_566041 [Zopfia rhizophila CBS 207.26]
MDWKPTWEEKLVSHRQTKGEGISDPESTSIPPVNGESDGYSTTSKGKDPVRDRTPEDSGGDTKGSRTGSLVLTPSESSSAQDPPNLASILSRTADVYLGLDLLGDDNQSRFFSHLLSNIERQQAQIAALEIKLREKSMPIPLPDLPNLPRASTGTLKPRMQILHRVFNFDNNGDLLHGETSLFEDEPKHIARPAYPGGWPTLQGRKPVNDLEAYLKHNPDICFLVFREHELGNKRRQSYHVFQTPNSRQQMSLRSERMRIVSETLKQAIRSVATCVPNEVSINHNQEMEAPYYFLYHHRSQLESLINSSPPDIQDLISLLTGYLNEQYGEEYAEADRLIAKGHITEKHIPKLFKPNQMILTNDTGKPQAYVTQGWPEEAKDSLTIHSWHWIFNGHLFTRDAYRNVVPFPSDLADSEVPILYLKYFPAKFAPETTSHMLVKRGRTYWKMRTKTFASYSGWDAWHDENYVNARVMIDTVTYHRMHGRNNQNQNVNLQRDYYDDEIQDSDRYDPFPPSVKVDSEMDAESLMLLPSTLKGFEIKDKKWIKLYVDQLHPVEWNKKAFERLVLDKKSKEMINALVSVHVQTASNRMHDIIRGKGNGLIILLHGSPGTGKTLTAESVAELAEKPLYSVSCGDIGIRASDVERHLKLVLYLGKIWDCVLLLDEADVFLEERALADLERNSLVSVFLRTLEYYDGILILTSNRVGTFDEAFKSRIQVALHYSTLTKKSRKQIWQNFFDMLEEADEDVNMAELERRLDELAAEEMNGRQIRNALLTARQLAIYRKQTLDWEHLHQVIRTAAEFSRYLKTLHGHSDEQWAREDGRR